MRAARRRTGAATGRRTTDGQRLLTLRDGVEKSLIRVGAMVQKYSPSIAATFLSNTYETAEQLGAEAFFLDLLHHYKNDVKTRKQLEKAAVFFSRTTVRYPKPKTMDEASRLIAKVRAEYESMFAVAERVVHGDVECGADQLCKVACFRLVNTAGFGAAAMREAQSLLEKASTLIEEAGFGKLCYGDVLLVNQIRANKNTAAIYHPSTDVLYVVTGSKKIPLALRTVLHELGHRLESKFLTPEQTRRKDALYRAYKHMGLDVPLDGEGPAPGTVLNEKKGIIAREVDYSKGRILLSDKSGPLPSNVYVSFSSYLITTADSSVASPRAMPQRARTKTSQRCSRSFS